MSGIEQTVYGGARNDRGVALFMVLWVLTLLSVIIGEFCYSMHVESRIAQNFKAQTEARYIAMAGIQLAVAGLVEKASMPSITQHTDEMNTDERWRSVKWRINSPNPLITMKNGTCEVWIDNESGKVDLNGADGDLLRFLFKRFDLTDREIDGIVDSVLDWRDMDSFHRLNGAEDDYYTSLSPAYECKDGPFESLQELAFVKGIAPEMISSDFRRLVTVSALTLLFNKEDLNKHTREAYLLREKLKNHKETDYYHLNINAASRAMLLSIPELTSADADTIADYRREKDIVSLSELNGLISEKGYANVLRYFKTDFDPFYTFHAVGYAADNKVKVTMTAFVQIDPKLEKKYTIISMRGI